MKVWPTGRGADEGWPPPTDEQLRLADAVVVLLSPAGSTSAEVHSSWTAAMGSNRRVIPVLIDGAEHADLAPALRATGTITLGADEEHGMDELVRSIRAAARSADPRPAAVAASGAPGREPDPVPGAGAPPNRDVFIVISFDEAMKPTIEAIKRAAKKAGLSARPISDDDADYVISERILEKIDKALFVVADLTMERPNVYFELGYARGKGKTVVTLLKEGSKAHVDVRGWTYIPYADSRPLEKRLVKRFKEELERLESGDEA
nr:TIR domain-containing protein [Actinomadura sp. K4S16]